MYLYVNGDSHTAGAEACVIHSFAEDDGELWPAGREPHPDNIAVSWGKRLSDRLGYNFVCNAESASSNTRIIRTTKNWIDQNPQLLDKCLIIIQWSTWEREEWLIDGTYYQVNASGIDHVPDSHIQIYKEYIANVDWKQKTIQAHDDIWQFHQYLLSKNIKHVMFNANTYFETSSIQLSKDWQCYFLEPYSKAFTYDSILQSKGFVPNENYHFKAEAHTAWAEFMHKYLVDNNFV